MLHAMFGMGGTEILVILIVALLFLGPDKLPEAAKTISKSIRDIKKQSRVLQRTIEDDEHIGGAIRDLRSALRGEDEPIPPPKPKKQIVEPTETPALPEPGPSTIAVQADTHTDPHADVPPTAWEQASEDAALAFEAAPERAKLTMPPTAGEPDDAAPRATESQDAELAALVKPAPNTIARAPRTADPADKPKQS
jgi:sec-independent protein translocase protein TatB